MLTYLVVAAVLAAFGSWRLAVGLYRLGVIKRRVPHTDTDRLLPKFMRAGDDVNGAVAVFGGCLFLIASAASLWAGLTQ